MNLAELIIDSHIKVLNPIKLIAKKYNISISQLFCIYSIPYDGISQKELADNLSLDISTLSRNLNNLISKKLIIKKKSTFDIRTNIIFLTPLGEQVNTSIINDINSYFSDINLLYDENVIELLINSLSQLNWFLIKKNK